MVRGLVAGAACPIGANVQSADHDYARLSDRVAHVNNGAGLVSEELPVPELDLGI